MTPDYYTPERITRMARAIAIARIDPYEPREKAIEFLEKEIRAALTLTGKGVSLAVKALLEYQRLEWEATNKLLSEVGDDAYIRILGVEYKTHELIDQRRAVTPTSKEKP